MANKNLKKDILDYLNSKDDKVSTTSVKDSLKVNSNNYGDVLEALKSLEEDDKVNVEEIEKGNGTHRRWFA